MFKIDSAYSNYFDMDDPNYPGGKSVDASTDEGIDGTPYKADWMNDVNGAFQALFVAAFGSMNGISNAPDNVNNSDVLKAIQKLIQDSFNKRVYQFELKESNSLIPWGSFNRQWNGHSTYLVMAQIVEDHGDTLPIQVFVDEDGVHLTIKEIKDGKVQPIYRADTFGSFNFGAKKWGERTPYKVNIIIQEA